jgi:hypothetical protein
LYSFATPSIDFLVGTVKHKKPNQHRTAAMADNLSKLVRKTTISSSRVPVNVLKIFPKDILLKEYLKANKTKIIIGRYLRYVWPWRKAAVRPSGNVIIIPLINLLTILSNFGLKNLIMPIKITIAKGVKRTINKDLISREASIRFFISSNFSGRQRNMSS